VNIRRAAAADAPALTRIAHAAKRHWGYGDYLIALWTADLTVTPVVIEADPVYCAVIGSDVVGFYALSREGAAFELEHMWVDPPSMRTGIGARLFRHALETAHALGGRTLTIASDPNAEGFYRRMGARRVGSAPSKPAGRELPLLVVDLG
jgi:GNAT superfamily N-acetyltransferase